MNPIPLPAMHRRGWLSLAASAAVAAECGPAARPYALDVADADRHRRGLPVLHLVRLDHEQEARPALRG